MYDVPHRGPNCPTGRHAADDPRDEQGEPLPEHEAVKQRRFNEVCDCPWLTVSSSTPVPHATTWTRRELENMIRNADEGYFDPQHFPPRLNQTRFMSPDRQYLLQLLDVDDRLGAMQHLLTGIKFDRVVWDPASLCLSLRRQAWGHPVEEWLQLHFDEAGQYSARADTPGGSPDTIDGLWEEAPVEVTAAAAETRALIDASRLQISGKVAIAVESESAAVVPPDGQGWVDIPLPLQDFDELRSDDDGS